MENGTFKHVMTYEFIRFSFKGFINPESFEMITEQLVMGIEDFYNQFSAMGNGGKLDSNFTIPSGSAIQTAFFSPSDDKLVLNVITENASEQYYVVVDYSMPEDMPKINGEALCDILENYDYAF